jgi:hypothetical protein
MWADAAYGRITIYYQIRASSILYHICRSGVDISCFLTYIRLCVVGLILCFSETEVCWSRCRWWKPSTSTIFFFGIVSCLTYVLLPYWLTELHNEHADTLVTDNMNYVPQLQYIFMALVSMLVWPSLRQLFWESSARYVSSWSSLT